MSANDLISRQKVLEIIDGIITGDYGLGGDGWYERSAESALDELRNSVVNLESAVRILHTDDTAT